MELIPDHIYTWEIDVYVIMVRYFFLAGVAWFFFYRWKRKIKGVIKIQKKFPSEKTIAKEIYYSFLTLLIYCAVSWFVFQWQQSGITRIYLHVYPHGWPYLVTSVVMMVLLHDTYFYWTHRLLHSPGIFDRIHKTHHLSRNPTPWAAFAFHPAEAVVSAAIIPLIIFVIPCHPVALFAFLTYMTTMNVIGHLGYEVFPDSINRHKILKWQNTSTNHNWHHEKCKDNYGLYFTFWDRIMKTYYLKNK